MCVYYISNKPCTGVIVCTWAVMQIGADQCMRYRNTCENNSHPHFHSLSHIYTHDAQHTRTQHINRCQHALTHTHTHTHTHNTHAATHQGAIVVIIIVSLGLLALLVVLVGRRRKTLWVCVYVCVCGCVCMFGCVYVCMYVWACMCAYVCLCVWMCVHCSVCVGC